MNSLFLSLVYSIGGVFFPATKLSVLFFIIILTSCEKTPNTPSIKEKPYECGMFGHQQMRIDRNYLFLTKVEYVDVDYWGGNSVIPHQAKGCHDAISSAAFRVSWPAMSATKAFNYLEKPDDLNIQLQQFAINTNLAKELKQRYLNEGIKQVLHSKLEKGIFGGEEMPDAEYKEKKQFNTSLDLYQIDVFEDEQGNKKTVYWQETPDKKVSVVIRCFYFKMGDTSCELNQTQIIKDQDIRYLTLGFRSELLPHWQQLITDSEKLVQSFTVVMPS
ncbi:hypothetical protein SAMN05444584_1254 [Acinetobacter apis]|uniref:Uncharacterized protein n=2 Tax=Acinetobacter apis TaxID=1229165 RepID=A0A217EG28_9GAMM|nr:hypothetical protein SAMN05444584_1254 [Acinetobacter apis]